MSSVVRFFLAILLVRRATADSESTTRSIETSVPTTTTPLATGTDEEDDVAALGAAVTTEEVTGSEIKIADVPDVDEPAIGGAKWDKNKAVKDVAYFLRVHKFRDYDRRYYRNYEDVPVKLYEAFPEPPLRALHWEVRKYCETSFHECLLYLGRVVKLPAVRREDDTVTIMRENKWSHTHNLQQVWAAQRECKLAQKRDNATAAPFQGPIERFQWRATASYYMCWYTMLGQPELAVFGEPCDNFANCLDDFGPSNFDVRADDAKPYACALYSFCPDHCCPIRHARYPSYCRQSHGNPCRAGNEPGHRRCVLKRAQNRDLSSLISNHLNVSCACRERGYEWSSRFGLCVDVNECARGTHNCSSVSETCVNLPGYHDCACAQGFAYDPEPGRCVRSATIEEALREAPIPKNVTKSKSLIGLLVQAIAGSAGTDSTIYTSPGLSSVLCLGYLNAVIF